MLNPSATFETKVNSASLSVVDIIEVDFGNGDKVYWSTKQVDNALLQMWEDAPTSAIEARILDIGDRTWNLGVDNSSLSLVLGNADSAISDLYKSNPRRFEGARVRLHRMVHTSAGKEVYEDYWVGEGLAPMFQEDVVEWEIQFGLGNLRQRFGRRFQFNCPHLFADDFDCPYNLQKGIGMPDASVGVTGTATSGGATSLVDSGAAFSSTVQVGWYVWMKTHNCYGRVSVVNSNTTLTIERGVGSGTISFGSGKYVIGPPFSGCSKTTAACKERGMFGTYNNDTYTNPVGNERRHFGGVSDASTVSYEGRYPSGSDNSGDRFRRNPMGNTSLDGKVIPVVIGNFRLRDIPSLYHAPAGRFQHGLFVLCEGECFDIFPMGTTVNGHPPDNSRSPTSNTNQILHDDSFTKWGTWYPNGIEDSRITSATLGKQVRSAVGRRASVAAQSRHTVIDTYGTGTYGNPYLFANAYGDGFSTHGLTVARVRIDTEEDNQDVLTGEFSLTGLICPLPPGSPTNPLDTRFNYTIDGTTYRYTTYPDPVQVAYAFLTNTRWGAGLVDARLDIQSFLDASAYCRGTLNLTEDNGTSTTGTDEVLLDGATVHSGPKDTEYVTSNLYDKRFVVTEHGEVKFYHKTLVGRKIKITEAGKEQTRNIVMVTTVRDETDVSDNTGGVYVSESNGPPEFVSITAVIIYVDLPWDEGKEPENGDTFDIVGSIVDTSTTYQANGLLADDISVGEMLERILENCACSFRMSDEGKLEVFARRALTSSELNTVVSNGIFTDRGVNRNIIRNNGVSTLKVWRDPDTEIPNELSVQFFDKDRMFRESRVVVYSEEAQKRAATLFGEAGSRRKITQAIDLNLTSTRDQASRILTILFREKFIQNLYCEFETSLKLAMFVEVGDIIAVESNLFPPYRMNIPQEYIDASPAQDVLFWRVLEKTETSKYTINLKCQVHVNSIYNNLAVDFGDYFGTDDMDAFGRNVLPADVTPSTPVEEIIIESDGKITNLINVEVTYPSG